ncbi:MAG: hypothetical protein BGO51_15770 [Rhodospirillales bacterium 69-11]|jgi:hypothetical protein|nr:MAG: hypothetical protein BGO51_15770 [Rhodospirillales bacterium 69-11]
MRSVLALLVMLTFGRMMIGPALAFDDLVLPKVAFSAVAVHETGALRTREKIFYTPPGKLRIEHGPGFAITILDFTTQSQVVLMANRTYLVMPMDDELYRRFVARTVAMSGAHRMGVERVDGMRATKYAFGDDGALNAAGFYWLADDGIMLKRVYDDGVYGRNVHHRAWLTDLSIKPQPDSLFGIPPGYKRVK